MKRIIIEGKEYRSKAEAARALGLKETTLNERLKNGTPLHKKCTPGKPVTIDGIEYCSIAEAARVLGLKEGTLQSRLDKGIPVHKKVACGVSKKITIDGIEYESIKKAAEALGLKYNTLRGRLKRNTDLHKPVSERIPCVYKGVQYPSINAAEKANGMHGTLNQRYKRKGDVADCDKRVFNCKPVVCDDGRVFNSRTEAVKALGISHHTLKRRIDHGVNIANYERKRKIHGRFEVRYKGYTYESIREAKEVIGKNYDWIVKNCELIPVQPMDLEYRRKMKYSLLLYYYMPRRWDENRIIEEVDRRMKKLFAHGRLINEKDCGFYICTKHHSRRHAVLSNDC